MGATKNNRGGHLKLRGAGKNSYMRAHTKFRGGPVTERGCLLMLTKFEVLVDRNILLPSKMSPQTNLTPQYFQLQVNKFSVANLKSV